MPSTAPPSLREMTRETVRARISQVAIELFAKHGFDHVTVEQVAAEAGISARSFNRYFASKEDAVVGDATAWGTKVQDLVASRPHNEPAWDSLRVALTALLAGTETSDDRLKQGMRVMNDTAALRARNVEKHQLWAHQLTPLIAAKLEGQDGSFRAETLVLAALSCFDITLATWAKEDETRSPQELLQIAFTTVQP